MSLRPATGTGGQGPMPRVKYHAGKCPVTGRRGCRCKDEGVKKEGEGAVGGRVMEWRDRDAKERWRARGEGETTN